MGWGGDDQVSSARSRLSRSRRVYGYRWCEAFRGFDGDHPACDASLDNMVAELAEMELLVSKVRRGLDQLGAALRLREKLRQLREGTAGRTDPEIETAHRLADRLEARARAAMSRGGTGRRRPNSSDWSDRKHRARV